MDYEKLVELVNGLNTDVEDDREVITGFIIMSDDDDKRKLYQEYYIKSYKQRDGLVEFYHYEENEKLRVYAVYCGVVSMAPLKIDYAFIDICNMNIHTQLKAGSEIKELLREYLKTI